MMRLFETRKQNTTGNQVNLIKMIGKVYRIPRNEDLGIEENRFCEDGFLNLWNLVNEELKNWCGWISKIDSVCFLFIANKEEKVSTFGPDMAEVLMK